MFQWKPSCNVTQTMIVNSLKCVTKAVVLMHVRLRNVETMQDVRLHTILQNAFALMATQEIHKWRANHVSICQCAMHDDACSNIFFSCQLVYLLNQSCLLDAMKTMTAQTTMHAGTGSA